MTDTERAVVPSDIAWQPAWLSWVGSVTTCLNALGHDVDQTEVAGQSGYAFALSINERLCPSGPTCLDWATLASALPALGRSVSTFVSWDCYADEFRNDRTRAHARAAFVMVRREAEAGRPSVVWGLGVPEFGVVRGVEGEEYLCVAGGSTPERLKWDEIDAPGGPYVLAMPTPADPQNLNRDRHAIRRGVEMMSRPDLGRGLTSGFRAFDFWISELEKKTAVIFGNSYNAQCWAEARRHARDFTARVAERNEAVADTIGRAHAAFTEVATHLDAIAERFPFTFEMENLTDEEAIAFAVDHLTAARPAEEEALTAMWQALEEW